MGTLRSGTAQQDAARRIAALEQLGGSDARGGGDPRGAQGPPCAPKRRRPLRTAAFVLVIVLLLVGAGAMAWQAIGTGSDAGLSASSRDGELVVHFLDVGQGDATFIELPDGTCLLIDAGGADTAEDLIAAIQALGYTRIDYLVATHPHADHLGGMTAVIEAFEIGELWASAATTTTTTYERFLDAASAAGLTITLAQAGMTITVADGCSVTVLGPAADAETDDLNEASVVIRIDYGTTSFLFTGDASAENLPTDAVSVLKVSHHGSNAGLTYELADALSPAIAVISYGLDNDYGHPKQRVLDILASVGAEVYGTGANGDVTVTSDGATLTVTCEKAGEVTAGEEAS